MLEAEELETVKVMLGMQFTLHSFIAHCSIIHPFNLTIDLLTDSAFKQQRLPAWQPILTAGTVLPTFFVIGVAFIPIGIAMLWFSENVSSLSFRSSSRFIAFL